MEATLKQLLTGCLEDAMKANDGKWAARLMDRMKEEATPEECGEMWTAANAFRTADRNSQFEKGYGRSR
jgi:hypothetical protein